MCSPLVSDASDSVSAKSSIVVRRCCPNTIGVSYACWCCEVNVGGRFEVLPVVVSDTPEDLDLINIGRKLKFINLGDLVGVSSMLPIEAFLLRSGTEEDKGGISSACSCC